MTEENSVTISLKEILQLEEQRQQEVLEAQARAREEEQRKVDEAIRVAKNEAFAAMLAEEERMHRERVRSAEVQAAYDAKLREEITRRERPFTQEAKPLVTERVVTKRDPMPYILMAAFAAVSAVLVAMAMRQDPPAPKVETVYVDRPAATVTVEKVVGTCSATPAATQTASQSVVQPPKPAPVKTPRKCPPGVPLCD